MGKDRAVCQAKRITQNISYHRQWIMVQTQADKWVTNVTWWHDAARQAAVGAGRGGEGIGGEGCVTHCKHTRHKPHSMSRLAHSRLAPVYMRASQPLSMRTR
jgi:hypothetical protein